MTLTRLQELIAHFTKKNLVVVGDVMLDEFIWGRVARISPEAPVPIVHVDREELFPGGAANVARNLRSLGAQVTLLGRIGTDISGKTLLTLLKKEGIGTDLILKSRQVPTIVKTRVIAKPQQVVRVDWEKKEALNFIDGNGIIKKFEKRIDSVDAVIIEDYGKGFVTQYLVDSIATLCRRKRKIWTVDPNPHNPLNWKGATAIKPNRSEAFAAAGKPLTSQREVLDKVGRQLLKKWQTQYLLMTLGEEGMKLFTQKGKPYSSPARAREVYDVSGAGDTAIAAFTLALAAGASAMEATELANLAAGIVVGKLGTATIDLKELIEYFKYG